MPETRELREEQWARVAGDRVVLKEVKENAINGKQKDNVLERTSVVSETMERETGKNRLQNPLHPPFHQYQEVEVRREKGASEAEASLGRPIDSHAGTSKMVLAQNYLMTIGILPNANSSLNQNRDVNSPQSAHFRTGRLRNNQTEGRRRVVTKMQQQQWKI